MFCLLFVLTIGKTWASSTIVYYLIWHILLIMEKCFRNIQKFQAKIICPQILKPAQNILALAQHLHSSSYICIYLSKIVNNDDMRFENRS